MYLIFFYLSHKEAGQPFRNLIFYMLIYEKFLLQENMGKGGCFLLLFFPPKIEERRKLTQLVFPIIFFFLCLMRMHLLSKIPLLIVKTWRNFYLNLGNRDMLNGLNDDNKMWLLSSTFLRAVLISTSILPTDSSKLPMDSDELTVYILGYNSCAKTHSELAQYFSVVNFIPFFGGRSI